MVLECELDDNEISYAYPYDEPFLEDDYSEESMP